jgi:hypothetical protein
MYLGLDLVWRVEIMHLHVESDSKVLTDMMTNKTNFKENIPILVRRIKQLLDWNWQVKLSHTWRERNRSADWLANFSYSLSSFNVRYIESSPRKLQSFLFYDIFRACFPKNIHSTLQFFFFFGPLLYEKEVFYFFVHDFFYNNCYFLGNTNLLLVSISQNKKWTDLNSLKESSIFLW